MSEPYSESARAVRQRAILPLAAVAPIALPWTGAASFLAVGIYEAALLSAWWRARAGRPWRVSNLAQNLLAIAYVVWFFLAARAFHPGLVRVATQLLLFTAAAKVLSFRSRREENMALLLCFFLALDSASTSTHVVSLLYLATVGVVAFRTLARLAVMADFDGAAPATALAGVPTAGVTLAAVAAVAVVSVPLFAAFPRLQSPFAVAAITRSPIDGSFFTSDRVDLQSFSSTKHSDRILFRVQAPQGTVPDPLRLRETTFNRYRDGHWAREGMVSTRVPGSIAGRFEMPPKYSTEAPVRRARKAESLQIDSSSFVPGFLFVPYGTTALAAPGVALSIASDATIAYSGVPADRGYRVEYVLQADGSGPGHSSVPLHDVPPEVVALSKRIAGDATSGEEIASRFLAYLGKGFTYRVDVPDPVGDPVVDFLTRTRVGHCEYFASALALMLRAQGIPARLATGSLGGEVGPLSSEVIVRGDNLHAWVEANLDGGPYRVLDPTPPEGRPGIVSVSLLRRLSEIGNEIEFFYDRNILGFSTLEQVFLVERFRALAARVDAIRLRIGARPGETSLRAGIAAAIAGALVLGGLFLLRRRRLSPATRAYLRLRNLHGRRIGPLPPSATSGAVIRGFATTGRQAGALARRIVEIYRAEAFGGVPADAKTAGELRKLVRDLTRVAVVVLAVALGAGRGNAADSAPPGTPPPADARYRDLRTLQQRVEESRARLAAAEKKTASLQQEIEALDLRLELAERQRELIAARRDDVARRARALQSDLETAQGARTRSLDSLRGRVRLLSRFGRFGYLRLLLEAKKTADVFGAMKTLDAMAQADARELARYTDAGRRLASDLAAQKDLEKETEQLLGQDRDEERRITAGKSERLRLLSRSKSETVATRREVTELSEKAEKLEALLDMLSRGESTATGSPRPWRGVLDWPVRGTIAVTFGRHRHPKFDAWTVSNGIDVAAPDGTPVTAVFGGKVVFARWFSDYGNMTVIDHGDEVLTLYARLRSILVHTGDLVATGDRIGLVGIGPGETEPSLYFEVRDHQKATDPVSWLR